MWYALARIAICRIEALSPENSILEDADTVCLPAPDLLFFQAEGISAQKLLSTPMPGSAKKQKYVALWQTCVLVSGRLLLTCAGLGSG